MECGGEGEGGVQEDFQLSSLSKWVDGGGRDELGTRGRAGASRQSWDLSLDLRLIDLPARKIKLQETKEKIYIQMFTVYYLK